MAFSPATKKPLPDMAIHSMENGFPILLFGESFRIVEKSPLLSHTMTSPVALQTMRFCSQESHA